MQYFIKIESIGRKWIHGKCYVAREKQVLHARVLKNERVATADDFLLLEAKEERIIKDMWKHEIEITDFKEVKAEIVIAIVSNYTDKGEFRYSRLELGVKAGNWFYTVDGNTAPRKRVNAHGFAEIKKLSLNEVSEYNRQKLAFENELGHARKQFEKFENMSLKIKKAKEALSEISIKMTSGQELQCETILLEREKYATELKKMYHERGFFVQQYELPMKELEGQLKKSFETFDLTGDEQEKEEVVELWRV